MYMELRITANYGNKQKFVEKLNNAIGANAITAESAVANTIYVQKASAVVPKVIAAEQIQHKTYFLHFLEGSDEISVHIAARTAADIKTQAIRIARQIQRLFERPSVKRRQRR